MEKFNSNTKVIVGKKLIPDCKDNTYLSAGGSTSQNLLVEISSPHIQITCVNEKNDNAMNNIVTVPTKDHNPSVVDGTLTNIYSKSAYSKKYGEISVDYEESTCGDESNKFLNHDNLGDCQCNVLISSGSVSSTSVSNSDRKSATSNSVDCSKVVK